MAIELKCSQTCEERRTRNASATSDAILHAAKKLFVEQGYEQTGLRAIARDAGIDPALICRYYGSKENLFARVLTSSPDDPSKIFVGERATFGERIANMMLEPARHFPSCNAFIGLVTRSSSSPVASKLLMRHIEQRFIKPFAEWIDDERSEEKAWQILSILLGFTVTRDLTATRKSQNDILAISLQAVLDTDPARLKS